MPSIWTHTPTPKHLNTWLPNTLAGHIGIEFTGVGDDYITARMPIDPRTHQPFGLLHGGASATLAETLGSIAGAHCVDMKTKHVVGLEINCNHIRGIKTGYVTGTTRPIHLGRTTQVWDIRIVDESAKLICISRLTLAVLDRK